METIITCLFNCVIVLGLVLAIGFRLFLLTAMIAGLIDAFKN